MDWLPIETAPKDGTVIDVWAVNRDRRARRITGVSWQRMTDWDGLEFDGWTGMFPERFCAQFEPTHWLPIPPPPRT